ncbi:MAG: hypothetical protein CMK59_06925, partial [Proteobacteria bacterium]|nr:hypothetical protein [Pseudomonadota bacterium]
MLTSLFISTFFLGCGEQASTKKEAKQSSCALRLDGMVDTEWVILKARENNVEEPLARARLKFFREGKGLKAKYNVMSHSDMYTYDCRIETDQISCVKPPDPQKLCQSLLVGGKKCAPGPVSRFYDAFEEEEKTKGIDAAKKAYIAAKKNKTMERFKFENNNLGNKLKAMLYISIDKNNCRLNVNDMYATIYNGKPVEDQNPVGINPFVKGSKEMLWEHCDKTNALFDTLSAEFPEKPAEVRPLLRHAKNEEIHYWLLYNPLREADSKCSYKYDLYLNGELHK